MNKLLIAALFVAGTTSVANAEGTATSTPKLEIKRNKILEDASGHSIGKVFEVHQEDGYVVLIDQMKMYRVPISSLTADGTKLKSSLTREQIGL